MSLSSHGFCSIYRDIPIKTRQKHIKPKLNQWDLIRPKPPFPIMELAVTFVTSLDSVIRSGTNYLPRELSVAMPCKGGSRNWHCLSGQGKIVVGPRDFNSQNFVLLWRALIP